MQGDHQIKTLKSLVLDSDWSSNKTVTISESLDTFVSRIWLCNFKFTIKHADPGEDPRWFAVLNSRLKSTKLISLL